MLDEHQPPPAITQMNPTTFTGQVHRFVHAPLLMFALSIAIAMASSSAMAETGRNPLPTFKTIDVDELQASFVSPTTWQVAFAKGKLMGSLVVTERPNDQATTPARFTVNPVSNLMRVRFRRVSEQIDAIEAALFSASSATRRLSSGSVQIGDYAGRDLLLRTEAPGKMATLERRLYLAHDARDWLVIVRFEAPESRWDELAPLRDEMFGRVVMN